jgi:hypothetical protein
LEQEMSWDIHVQDFGPYASIDEIPTNFRPGNIGYKVKIFGEMLEVAPQADFSDPTWGLIDTEDGSIEVNIGQDDPVDGFMLHVRGGPLTLETVWKLLRHLELRGLDMQTGDFLAAENATESFDRWRDYRDQVIRDASSEQT